MAVTTDAVSAEELAEAMAERFADCDETRVVAYYSPAAFGVVSVRDDVEATYDEADHVEVLEDAVLESLAADHFEDYFDDELVGTVRVFEEKVVLYCCATRRRGVLLSLDRGADLDRRRVMAAFEEEVHDRTLR